MKTGQRVFYAAVGVVIMLFAGFVYAWSILSGPISADFPQWSNGGLSLTFTICMAFFCLGGLTAGSLSQRIPPRWSVLISAALFLMGFFLASRAQSLSTLYLSYGMLCGTASGFAYNAVMRTVTGLFPGSQGLISGVLLMGFGSSSLIIGSAFTALTPDTAGAWRTSFLFMGVLMAAVLLLGSFFMKTPVAADSSAQKKGSPQTEHSVRGPELAPAQMLRKSSFWLFFLWAVLLSGVGLAIIAQAKPIAALIGIGLSAGTLSLVVGLISVCNGLGRILFGWLFDHIGWRRTLLYVNLLSIISGFVLIVALLTNVFPLVVVGFLGTGVAYGGVPTLCAAVIRAFYGVRHYAVNFQLVLLNLLPASFGGTAAGALFDASGSYLSTFLALVACSTLALLVQARIKQPELE